MVRRIGRRRLQRRFPAGLKNAQLDLYSQVLQGDFLHYGYFDDAGVPPERISFHDMQHAQLRGIIRLTSHGPIIRPPPARRPRASAETGPAA